MIALFFMLLTGAGAGGSLAKWVRAEWDQKFWSAAGWFALFLICLVGFICWTTLWVIGMARG